MNIYILSGPVGSGKTTTLKELCSSRKEFRGILSPVVNGKRVFVDIESGEQWPMEEQNKEAAILVGRYRFSLSAFEKASAMIEKLISEQPEWIVLDEIGPLELNNKGFYNAVVKMNEVFRGNVLLVVREGLVESVKRHFNFKEIQVVGRHEIRKMFFDDSAP